MKLIDDQLLNGLAVEAKNIHFWIKEPGGLVRVSQDYFHCCLLDFHAHVPVEA